MPFSDIVRRRAQEIHDACAADPRESVPVPRKQRTGKVQPRDYRKPPEKDLRAASLYLAGLMEGEPITQEEAAQTEGVTTRALRAAYAYVVGVSILERIA